MIITAALWYRFWKDPLFHPLCTQHCPLVSPSALAFQHRPQSIPGPGETFSACTTFASLDGLSAACARWQGLQTLSGLPERCLCKRESSACRIHICWPPSRKSPWLLSLQLMQQSRIAAKPRRLCPAAAALSKTVLPAQAIPQELQDSPGGASSVTGWEFFCLPLTMLADRVAVWGS